MIRLLVCLKSVLAHHGEVVFSPKLPRSERWILRCDFGETTLEERPDVDIGLVADEIASLEGHVVADLSE